MSFFFFVVVLKGYYGDKVIDDRELEFSLGEGKDEDVLFVQSPVCLSVCR